MSKRPKRLRDLGRAYAHLIKAIYRAGLGIGIGCSGIAQLIAALRG